MLFKLMRHVLSHKKNTRIDVDPLDAESLEHALDHLNSGDFATLQSMHDLNYQHQEKSKLVRIEFCHQGTLLCHHASLWTSGSEQANTLAHYMGKLQLTNRRHDYGASEFIFIYYALQHPHLQPKVIEWINKITVYLAVQEYDELTYSDLSPVGGWASLMIALKAPAEIDAAVSLFNEYSITKSGMYTSYRLLNALMTTYNMMDDHEAFLALYCSQLSSYLWMPMKRWHQHQEIIDHAKFADQTALKRVLISELTRWTKSLPLGEHTTYMDTFIHPILHDEDDRKEIAYLLEQAQRQAAFMPIELNT